MGTVDSNVREIQSLDILLIMGFTGELSEKLLGADMITRHIYDHARNVAPGMVEMDRAAVLFNAVLASVKLNPAKYAQFISILQQIQGSSDLVDFIKGGFLYFRPTWFYYCIEILFLSLQLHDEVDCIAVPHRPYHPKTIIYSNRANSSDCCD